MWLPPLSAPPTLDEILPPLDWSGRDAPAVATNNLVIPVGVVDRPFEQQRDLLMADLSGAGGHAGIAGGPQSGKSTMLRSLIGSLALTHTPE